MSVEKTLPMLRVKASDSSPMAKCETVNFTYRLFLKSPDRKSFADSWRW
jgi:hypothetical protein